MLLSLVLYRSDPICAASNNHSPNNLRILLHLGRAEANRLRASGPIEDMAVDEGNES